MNNGTYTKAGLLADAGAPRPRSGKSSFGVNACAWIGMSTTSASQVFDTTIHLARRLQESSQ
jgi:hypothetical protein